MLVKNCAGAEIIPFPGACRGGCSLGWRWSDTLLIAARVALFLRLSNSVFSRLYMTFPHKPLILR